MEDPPFLPPPLPRPLSRTQTPDRSFPFQQQHTQQRDSPQPWGIHGPQGALGRPYAHLNEQDALEEFQFLCKRAFTVARCGDHSIEALGLGNSLSTVGSNSSNEDISSLLPILSRFTLYLKALGLFEIAMENITKYKMEFLSQKSHFSNRTGTVTKLDSLLEWLNEQFQTFFKRADRLKKHIQDTLGMSNSVDEEQDSGSADEMDDEESVKGKRRRGGKVFPPERLNPMLLPTMNIPSAEKLIYEWAMKWAKDAAIEEMMNNNVSALANYRAALRLFEQLVTEQVDQHDTIILQSVISDLQTRIDSLQGA